MARLLKNGMIGLDLRQPDEVCLLPAKWGGKYPNMTSAQRMRKLSEQQNHRCCYCGVHTWTQHYGESGPWQTMATIEHIKCRRDGGTNKKGNIVMACSRCNNHRGRYKNHPTMELPFLFMLEQQGRLPDWEIDPPLEVS